MNTVGTEPGVAIESLYRVGDLTVNPSRRIVLRRGEVLSMGRLTFDLFLLLVEAAPGVISQQQIMEQLWPRRCISEGTVRQRIKLLRKSLSDDSSNPRYLNVVRGQGVGLIPPVQSADSPAQTPGGQRRLWQVAFLAVIAAIVAIVASIVAPKFMLQPDIRSLAVLPFEALSPEPGDAHFADGFHNDLLTQLAGIGDLKVISRTSVLDYRDRPRNVRQIARELEVSAILEGSIQRSGNNVRVNAQLIDAVNDRHLWAQAYDRELTAHNLFDIQDELAVAITGAMQVELSSQESNRIRSIPTESTRAYNQYLLGQYYSQGFVSLENFSLAIDAFQQAVTEDPEFALAWSALAKAHSTVYFFHDRTEHRRALAKASIDRALEIDRDLPEAHLALGYYRYHAERDYQGALSAWQIAELGLSGDPRLYEARATVYMRMGESLRSVDNLKRAIELDPRDESKLTSLAWQYSLARDYENARIVLERVIALAPDKPIGYQRLANLPFWRDGDGTAVRAVLAAAPIKVRAYPTEWLASIYERDFDAAFTILDEWPGDGLDTHREFRSKAWFYGTTHSLSGEVETADMYYRHAEARVKSLLRERPKDFRLLLALASSKANLGATDQAAEIAAEVLRSMKAAYDAPINSLLRLNAIKVFLAIGDFDAVLRELDIYLSEPGTWSAEGLRPDPRFDPIRNDPRFIALIERHARS